MSDLGDRAREEFFSEAQELIDVLGRHLLDLDAELKAGRTSPAAINDVFRAVHTLKGLAGLFGAAVMSGLSHELENVLDDLRLGRLDLSPQVLDILFRAVDLYGRILTFERDGGEDPSLHVQALLAAVSGATARGGSMSASPAFEFELDASLLGVLTEYEEHRLRTNIQSGVGLFRLRVRFSLSSIDAELDELKANARPHGEIITYLPSGDAVDPDVIELEILLASMASKRDLEIALGRPNLVVEEIRRRGSKPRRPAPLASDLPMPVLLTGARGDGHGDDHLSFPSIMTRGLADAFESTTDLEADVSVRTPFTAGTGAEGPSQRTTTRATVSPPALREATLRSVTQTVRVDIRKLDRLMNVVGELAIVKNALHRLETRVRRESKSREATRETSVELHRLVRAFERTLGTMQHGILEVRMVPLGQAFDKLARIVRQMSRAHEKQVNLVVTGAETELDKLIVEELSDPLMHMMRNAIDHGIESREERLRLGKPAIGTIALNAFQKGNQVVLEIEDDGRGIDPEVVRRAAVKQHLLTLDEASGMTDREVMTLVFAPGFTTKSEATDTSGRGVGMDVVKTNIGKLGGVVDVTSEVGIGTKMAITLPITLAIISVLMVEVTGRTYAIPLASVEEAIAVSSNDIRVVEGREVMTQRGKTLALSRLSRLFGFELGRPSDRSSPGKQFVVISSIGGKKLGFVVDKLLGQEDIVIKALGKSLARVRGFAGATELGDQRVALVIDAAALMEEVSIKDRIPRPHGDERPPPSLRGVS